MQLQLALDMMELPEALAMAEQVESEIDIIEIGTPFIVREGIRAVTAFKKAFPHRRVLADLKIMDAGEHEARMAIEAGADLVTVLGVADDATIRGTLAVARNSGCEVLVDMICVPDVEKRAAELDEMGVDYICAHTAFDVQDTGRDPLAELLQIQRVAVRAGAAVAGGITRDTIGVIAARKPAILIVGGGITGQIVPKEAAAAMRKVCGEAMSS